MKNLPVLFLLFLLTACQPAPESPAPSATPIPIGTPIPTATAIPSPTPTPTESPEEAAARLAQLVRTGEISLAEATVGMRVDERLALSQVIIDLVYAEQAHPTMIRDDGKTVYLRKVEDGWEWSLSPSKTKLPKEFTMLPASATPDGLVHFRDEKGNLQVVQIPQDVDSELIRMLGQYKNPVGRVIDPLESLNSWRATGRNWLPIIFGHESGKSRMRFNVTHSGKIDVYAIVSVFVPKHSADGSLLYLQKIFVPINFAGGFFQFIENSNGEVSIYDHDFIFKKEPDFIKTHFSQYTSGQFGILVVNPNYDIKHLPGENSTLVGSASDLEKIGVNNFVFTPPAYYFVIPYMENIDQ